MTVASDNQILDYDSIFFQGVVESRNDPLFLGRVKVRIFGLHTDNFELLTLDELPWAAILIPASDSAPGGQGISSSGIPPGTHIFGMFLDGINRQMPLVLGSIKGIPRKPEESPDRAGGEGDKNEKGDKENIYAIPKEETELGVDFRKGLFDPHEERLTGYPRPNRMKQPETHPFLRNSGKDGIEKNIESERPKDALQNLRTGRDRFSEGDTIWKEPESAKQTDYPHNRVYESESGIGSEIDDTPYHERNQQFFLPSTNYVEWATRNGVELKRIWGASYDVRHSPVNKFYNWGERTSTIMGNVMEVSAKSKTSEIYDTETRTVYDSQKLRLFGQHNEWVGDNFSLMVNNDIKITANNTMSLDVGSQYQQSFHDTHHSVFWMRQYIWNEGQLHHIRKRNYFEKTNENHFTVTWFDKRDVTIIGSKHWTVAGSYFISTGACGGDFHHQVVDGSAYLTVKKENHIKSEGDYFLSSANANVKHNNEYKQLQSFNNTIGNNYNEKINTERAIQVSGTNKIQSSEDLKVVKGEKHLVVGSSSKQQTGSNLEEKVGRNKISQIGNDFLQQFKQGVTKATNWLLESDRIKIVVELYDRISEASRHLMQSGAIHAQNDFSGRVNRNASFTIDGDLGIEVKGFLRIKAKKGIFISCDDGTLTMGSKKQMLVGSQTNFTSVAPPKQLLHIEQAMTLPVITVKTEDLSGMDKSIPSVPAVSVQKAEFEDPAIPSPPKEATSAKLPPLPQIGDFINNRPSWAKADGTNKENDNSSDCSGSCA